MVLAAPASADDDAFRYRELGRADIEAELIGTTVEGFYASGGEFTEVFGADFVSLYRDERGEISGRMTFEGDTLCFAYGSPEMTGGCFVVWQRSPNCYDFYAAQQGAAFAGFFACSLGMSWDARVWRTNSDSTCPTVPIS